MAKSSRKTIWLISAVLVLIAAQVAVLGYIVAQTFARQNVVQNRLPNGRQVQGFPPPVAQPSQLRPQPPRGNQRGNLASSRSTTVPKAPKIRPTGPRADPPQFSRAGGVCTNSVTVEIKAKSANAAIRYTLDGSDPVEISPIYSSPLTIRNSTVVRAACFEKDLAPSLSIAQTYTMVNDDLLGFSSNLPIIVINAFNQPISYMNSSPVSVRFIDAGQGRATLLGAADFDSRADLKRRGYSSLRYPKMSLTIKTRDGDGDKAKSSIFGLPSDSDWVLYAPYVDKTLIRDALGYELSNEMGRYASRTRFVEVFIHRNSGRLSYNDYAGVYMLAEKIKRGKERVNIDKLRPEDSSEPEISGGYILKRDHGAMTGTGRGFGPAPRPSNDGTGFITPRGLHLFYVEPEEAELTDAQKNWLARYFADFERALNGPKFASPTEGYAKYLDVDAFIDHFWLVELTKNVDAFRYSSFLYKPRGGKITMGPAWDWNLSLGNADYYDAYETSGWYFENLRDNEISWIYRLQQDPEFVQRMIDRWSELRRGPISSEKILARVDALRTQLMEAQERNFAKWPVMGRGIRPNYYVGPTYDAEVNWMKIWIKDRISWLDRQYPVAPKFSTQPGEIAAGTKLELTGGPGEVFYTTDGTDPRAPGGATASGAQQYKGPLAIDGAKKIMARVRRNNVWSGPVSGSFTAKP